MRPSEIKIAKGALVPQLKGAIGSLSKLLGQMGIGSISGAVEAEQTPDGWNLHFPRRASGPSRCYVLSTGSSTTLPAILGLSAITYDVEAARTASLLGSLSDGVFTFTKPGLYHALYAASIEFVLSGATGPTPGVVSSQANLRVGGVSLDLSRSDACCPLTPNFDGFVTNEGAIEQSVSLDGVTGKTEVLTPVSAVLCNSITGTVVFDEYGQPTGEVTIITNSCANVLSAMELDGENKLDITIDDGQDVDVDSSLEVIADSEPAGLGYGTVTGQALVRVIRNATGELKILDGVTERSPTIEIYATVANGAAVCVNASLSISKL